MRLVIQLVPNLDEFFFRGRQKTFCCFCCVFRSHQHITYETPTQEGDTHTLYIVTGCRAAVFWLLDTHRKKIFWVGWFH